MVILGFKYSIQVFYKHKSPAHKVAFSAVELFFKSYFKLNLQEEMKCCCTLKLMALVW